MVPTLGDPRNEFVTRLVAGKSFCDVGGLWGTTSEKVSVASAGGASRLAMIDICPEGGELWRAFQERLASKGAGGVECISADITSGTIEDRFDIVHCSGVVYHTPSPLRTLAALRGITGEHLVLTSIVVPEKIQNAAGVISFAPGQTLFLPNLGEQELAVLRLYVREAGIPGAQGIDIPVPHWSLEDYGPWWWLFTVSAVRQMLPVVGFEVVDEAPSWGGRAQTFLARCV